MKKLLLIAISAIMVVSCTEKPQYKIDGTATDMDGKYIYLKKLGDKNFETLDSALVKDGKFEFKGSVEKPETYFLSAEDLQNSVVFVENGAKITVALDGKKFAATGSEMNDKTNEFLSKTKLLNEKSRDIYNRYIAAKQDGSLTKELEAQIMKEDSLNNVEIDKIQNEFINENLNTLPGIYFLPYILSGKDTEEIEEIMSKATEETKQYPSVKKVLENLANAKKVAVGQPFIDFESKDVNDKPVKLSDYVGKGKYVLIDFWASWCGPCRAEIPELVNVYAKYKNKNFEIVGVSFDSKKEDWIKGIKDLKITWPQMSDLKQWDCQAVKLYSIRGIPHTVLVDPQGVIVAKDLRAKEIGSKLAELLK